MPTDTAPRNALASSPTPVTDTFDLDMERLGIVDTFAPTATLHCRRPITAPTTTGLPTMSLGTSGSEIWTEGEKLGEGGMGVVYAVTDTVLVRTVAMKRARREGGPRAAHTLIAEARTLAALDHPNVVPVHSLGLDTEGSPILVMKRVSGRRWSDLIREGRSLKRDLHILLEVTDALRFAHARGLLHRDLKPDNIMVGEFGEVYLMDWGCACRIDEQSTREIVGTPAYMAPEMLRIGAPIGPATDVFLLGGLLQEAVTGQPRHTGRTVREVIESAMACRPMTWGPEVPAALGTIIERACARAIEDRYPTVEAFAAAIQDFVAHQAAALVAARATAALARLRAAVAANDAGAEVLFAECRFGFQGALEGWPDCEEAQTGLAQAYALYLPWKIRIGELGTAEALLPEVEPEAGRRWAAEIASARKAQALAVATLHNLDLSVASRERRSLAIGVFVTGLMVVAFGKPPDPSVTHLVWDHVMLACHPVLVVMVWVFILRRRIFVNRVSRSIVMAILLLLLGQVLHRALGLWTGSPLAEILRGDSILMGVGLAVLALSTHIALVLAAIPYLLGAAAMTARPDLVVQIFPAAMMLSSGIIALAFVLHAQQQRKAP